MEISKQHIKLILNKLQDVYPFMLEGEGYRELAGELTSEHILDGHLLYLWEKGLIDTQMNFDQFVPEWDVSAHLTRINSSGIDYLSELKTFRTSTII